MSCDLQSVVPHASQGHGHGGSSACPHHAPLAISEAATQAHAGQYHTAGCCYNPSSNIGYHIAGEVVNSHRVPTQQPSNRIAKRR
jgi:hypothetical protein